VSKIYVEDLGRKVFPLATKTLSIISNTV